MSFEYLNALEEVWMKDLLAVPSILSSPTLNGRLATPKRKVEPLKNGTWKCSNVEKSEKLDLTQNRNVSLEYIQTTPKIVKSNRRCNVSMVKQKVKDILINSILLVVNISFILGGAGVFSYYEGQHLRKTNMRDMELRDLVSKTISQDDVDWLATNASTKCSNVKAVPWTFGQSFNFALSIITTVGWGVMSPSTGTAKALVSVYALIGIPIYGIFIGIFKDFCAKNFKKLVRVPKRWKYYWVVLSIIIVLIIFSNIAVNWALEMSKGKLRVALKAPCREINGYEYWQENKTVWEGLYFGFITVSTIGFGDEYHRVSECQGSSAESVLTAFVGFVVFTILVGMTAHLFDILSEKTSETANYYDTDSESSSESACSGASRFTLTRYI